MLISFTDIDGCGKGTQIRLLSEYLEDKNHENFISKAYGDMEKEIFSVFMGKWDDRAVLFLFQALHVQQHLRARKQLEKGRIVIADRWDESYLAYHSKHGILQDRPELRSELNKIAFQGLKPDITFLLDTSVDVAQERMQARGADYFDDLSKSYHLRMRDGYLQIVKERNGYVIDGGQPIEKIHNEVIEVIDKHI